MPGAISPATGLVKNANSTWLIGRPLREDLERTARARRCASRTTPTASRSRRRSTAPAPGSAIVFGVILGTGTGGGIVADGQVLVGRERDRRGVGTQPAAVARRGRVAGSAVLLRPHGLHRDVPVRTGLSRDHQAATGDALDARRPSPPRAAAGDAAAAATLDALRAAASRERSPPIINVLDPRRHRARRRAVEHRALYERVPRLWGRFVFSDRVATRAPARAARRLERRARRGVAVATVELDLGSFGLRPGFRPVGLPRLEPDELDHRVELVGGDPEVRRVPHRLAVAEQDGLRRFVTDAERVASSSERRRWLCTVIILYAARAAERSMCTLQLVERFAADPAGAAVLEEQHRPVQRFGDSGVEVVDMGQMG